MGRLGGRKQVRGGSGEAAGRTGGRNDHSTFGKIRITEESVTADTARGQPGDCMEEILQVPE